MKNQIYLRGLQFFGPTLIDENGEPYLDPDWDNRRGYGDNFSSHTESMSTAIMLIYTDEGFVIASDSRGSHGGNGERKLFPTHGLKGKGVFSVSGAASFPAAYGPIDPFAEIYDETTQTLAGESFLNLIKYATKFSDCVRDKLHRCLRDWCQEREANQVQISEKLKQEQSVVIQFAGYWGDKPSMCKRRIYYGGEGETATEVLQESNVLSPYSSQHYYVGSDKVLRSLIDRSQSLAKFYVPAFKKLASRESISAEEAKTLAENYIEACKSKEGHEIDSGIGDSIGGEVAMAVVTQTKGFDWIKQPPPF